MQDEIQNITCIHGDCTQVMTITEPGSVGMIFTDPPYLMDYQSNFRSKDEDESSREKMKQKKIKGDTLEAGKNLIRKFYARAYRVLQEDAFMYVCFKADGRDNGNYVDLGRIFKGLAIKSGFDIRNTIIWVKNNWSAGNLEGAFGFHYESILLLSKGNPKIRGKRWTDIWEFDRVPDGKRVHPNQKPLPLIARAINSCSDPGDLILDPFAGSGATGLAAYQCDDRQSVLIEDDSERYNEMVSYIREKAQPMLF